MKYHRYFGLWFRSLLFLTVSSAALQLKAQVTFQGQFQFNNLRPRTSGNLEPITLCGTPIGTNHFIMVTAWNPRIGKFVELTKGGVPFRGTTGLAAPKEGFFTAGVLEVPFWDGGSVELKMTIQDKTDLNARPGVFSFKIPYLSSGITPPVDISDLLPGEICPCWKVGSSIEFPEGNSLVEGKVISLVLHNQPVPGSPSFNGFSEAGSVMQIPTVFQGQWVSSPVTNMAIATWVAPPETGWEPQRTGYKSNEGWYGDDVIIAVSVGLNCTAGVSYRKYPVHVLPDPRRPFLVFESQGRANFPRFSLRGLVGKHHVIESSADLKVWTKHAELEGNSSEIPVQLGEGDITSPRFFRVLTID